MSIFFSFSPHSVFCGTKTYFFRFVANERLMLTDQSISKFNSSTMTWWKRKWFHILDSVFLWFSILASDMCVFFLCPTWSVPLQAWLYPLQRTARFLSCLGEDFHAPRECLEHSNGSKWWQAEKHDSSRFVFLSLSTDNNSAIMINIRGVPWLLHLLETFA